MENRIIRPAEVINLPDNVVMHEHNYHQLVIATKGSSESCIEGLEDKIVPGQACIVTASSSHAFNALGQSEILLLNIENSHKLTNSPIEKLNSLLSTNQSFKLDNQFQTLLQLLVNEIKTYPEDLLIAEACKNTIVALLQRHIETDYAIKTRINMTVIDNYIHQQMTSKITVAQLAGCVFLGESQFHHLFKQQIGKTPHQYILQIRLNLAKKLLQEGTLTLSAVANAAGFANQSSLTHAFTKFHGISPSKYRH
ncbi:AraC family transcriptional regulator [Psychromonas sp. RZ22]|uniref:AraC family transcriptional regulator n=1 Tax=Psychromonas algarum TaxID=2555643 RepID=UPI001068CBC7|nr:AraC family transcriptional regulator [Psychromonas sp. RZ22]TEW55174.1 AraC family transcriptional regulator [Psychromonas sp. RZ22]